MSSVDDREPPAHRRDRVDASIPRRLAGHEIEALVERVRSGDASAWETLVRCLSPAVYRALAAFGLKHDVRDDAFSSTWARLFERIDTIEKPASLTSWLMTTAHNEALQHLRSRSRHVPVDDIADTPDRGADLDEALLDDELHVAVLRAFRHLSDRCQRLLRVLTVDPPLPYSEVVTLLGMPQGSIGPTRARCLDRLRARPELVPFLEHLTDGEER